MGYTHYWTQPRDFNGDEFAAIAADIGRIIAASNVPIGDWAGEPGSEPELTGESIGFNGLGDDGHETFAITPKRELPYEGAERSRLGWGFCKTGQKPYDAVVTAVLAYLASSWGFKVSSDGDASDWTAGIALAERALERPVANPIREDA